MSCYNNLNPKCYLPNNGVKFVLVINPKDIKSKGVGEFTFKRKYGKFKREVLKYQV